MLKISAEKAKLIIINYALLLLVLLSCFSLFSACGLYRKQAKVYVEKSIKPQLVSLKPNQ